MLVDEAVIFVQSGKGGDGLVSFRREKYVPKGGPDGGDGGRGGGVYIRAVRGVDTLLDMAGRHHWRADDGQPGQSKSCHGASADDLIIHVPPGTQIHDDDTGELLDDLDTPDKQLLAARGGDGGFGNEHFKNATHQAPRTATQGGTGEQRRLRLTLKVIADVGLVGMPNAGKSTLLSRLSAAHPKIADYPFTTLEPQLGIAELSDERRLVLADIPGLIEGAHAGAGLGDQFLKHIERTRILVHLLELDPTDGSQPADNYHAIRRELASYSPNLAAKDEIVVLNKTDLLPDDSARRDAAEQLASQLDRPVISISAVTGHACRQLLEECWKKGRGGE